MANVSFTRGTDATSAGSTATGRLTFNTANGVISLGLGSSTSDFHTINRVSATYKNTQALTVTTASATNTDGTIYTHTGKYTVTVPGILTFITFTKAAGNASYGNITYSARTTATTSGVSTAVTFTSVTSGTTTAMAPSPKPSVAYHLRYIPCG